MAETFGVDPDVIHTWEHARWLRFKRYIDDKQREAAPHARK